MVTSLMYLQTPRLRSPLRTSSTRNPSISNHFPTLENPPPATRLESITSPLFKKQPGVYPQKRTSGETSRPNPDHPQQPPAHCPFLAVAEQPIHVARRAKLRHKNILLQHSGLKQLQLVRLLQIEQHLLRGRLMPRRHHVQPLQRVRLVARPQLIKKFRCIGKLRGEIRRNLCPDFVAAPANRRPDRREQILRLRPKLHLHLPDRLRHDPCQRPAPPRVNRRHDALLWIDHQHRRTIRRPHSEQQSFAIRRERIALALLTRRRIENPNHIRMNLVQRHKIQIARANRRLKSLLVCFDVLALVPFHRAKIQNFFTIDLADATLPHGKSMRQPRQFVERGSLQRRHAALRPLDPILRAQFLCTNLEFRFSARFLVGCSLERPEFRRLRFARRAALPRRCFLGDHNPVSIIAVAAARWHRHSCLCRFRPQRRRIALAAKITLRRPVALPQTRTGKSACATSEEFLIIGLGVDIAEVGRIKSAIERHGETILRRLYTTAEREYCERFKNKYERYAGRPTMKLHGEAGKISERLGVKNISLSITHTADQAFAQVIFEN